MTKEPQSNEQKKAQTAESASETIAHIPVVSAIRSRRRTLLRVAQLFVWSVALLVIGFMAALMYGPDMPVSLPRMAEAITEREPSFQLTYGEQPLLRIESFFASTREKFMEENMDFIEADLATMKLKVYEDGIEVLQVPIKTKGKEGSWWETPAGIYAIQSKEKSHFSSFGKVYQPWSMAFQGNFFIHGWPTYPDGKPVSSSFSGGCIRLADEDAVRVYERAKVGTPILVHEKDYANDPFSYQSEKPNISASSYLVADIKSGAVLVEKGSNEYRPVASITKLVTALVSAEYINLDKTVAIHEGMLASTSIPRLSVGTEVSAYGLLFPLLKESSNEAAEALAQNMGRSFFITRMNEKARSIGMASSTFADVSGADAKNISTANDLFHLARYLYNNRSFILRITSDQPVISAYDEPEFTGLQNFNVIPGVGGFVGGKVGKTNAAGETGIYLFKTTVSGEERTLAVIVLGSKDRTADARELLSFMKERYKIELMSDSL